MTFGWVGCIGWACKQTIDATVRYTHATTFHARNSDVLGQIHFLSKSKHTAKIPAIGIQLGCHLAVFVVSIFSYRSQLTGPWDQCFCYADLALTSQATSSSVTLRKSWMATEIDWNVAKFGYFWKRNVTRIGDTLQCPIWRFVFSHSEVSVIIVFDAFNRFFLSPFLFFFSNQNFYDENKT